MKIPDISLVPPRFTEDPNATREMAYLIAKLTDVLRDIYSKLGTVEVVTSAPGVTQLDLQGDGRGGVVSDIKILDSATQSDRKLYYLNSAGTLRLIDSA